MTIPQSRIDAAREACAKATPEPWIACHESPRTALGGYSESAVPKIRSERISQFKDGDVLMEGFIGDSPANIEFVALARTELPVFADALEAAQARIITLQEELDVLKPCFEDAKRQRDEQTQRLTDSMELHIADESTIYQLEKIKEKLQARITELEAVVERAARIEAAARSPMDYTSPEVYMRQIKEALK